MTLSCVSRWTAKQRPETGISEVVLPYAFAFGLFLVAAAVFVGQPFLYSAFSAFSAISAFNVVR